MIISSSELLCSAIIWFILSSISLETLLPSLPLIPGFPGLPAGPGGPVGPGGPDGPGILLGVHPKKNKREKINNFNL